LQGRISRSFSAGQKLCSLIKARPDIAFHPLTMLRRDKRPEVGRRIKRISYFQVRHGFEKLLHETVVDYVLQNQARTSNTGLPLATEDCPHSAFYCGFHVSIGKHDVR
jgi:hypothetical protein